MGDVFDAVVGQPEAVAQLRAAGRPPGARLPAGGPGRGRGPGRRHRLHRRPALCPTAGTAPAGTAAWCWPASTPTSRSSPPPAPSSASATTCRRSSGWPCAARSRGPARCSCSPSSTGSRPPGRPCSRRSRSRPASTVFVILADAVVPELVTIASRCVRIDLPALTADALDAQLQAEGVEPGRAREAAEAAGGQLRPGPPAPRRPPRWRPGARRGSGCPSASTAPGRPSPWSSRSCSAWSRGRPTP